MTDCPSMRVDSAKPSVSERELAALGALREVWYGGEPWVLCFDTIASDAKIERKGVRRTVRSLARKGLAEYHRSSWTEDGVPAGAGYCITDAGVTLYDELVPDREEA